MSTVRPIRWESRLERQSKKRGEVDSSPAGSKNCSFCNFRFLRVAHRSNHPMPNEINRGINLAFTLF